MEVILKNLNMENKMERVPDGSYLVIQSFMRNELDLKGTELLVYAIIYGFGQDGESFFTGSAKYLAEWVGVEKRTVLRVLETLVEKGLIVKKTKMVNGVKLCDYTTKPVVGGGDKMSPGVTKCHRGGDKMSPGGGDKMSHHNIDIDNIEHNLVTKARLKSERGKNSSKTVKESSVVASKTLTHLKEKQAKGSTKALAKSPSTMEIKNQSSPAVVKPTTKKNKVDGKLKAMWFAEMLDTWEKAMGVKLKLAGQSRTYNCEAVTRLVLYYNQDIEQLKRTIMALPELSKEQGEYALEISDFVDLEQKLNKIMAWGRKRQLNQMKKAQEEQAAKEYKMFDTTYLEMVRAAKKAKS